MCFLAGAHGAVRFQNAGVEIGATPLTAVALWRPIDKGRIAQGAGGKGGMGQGVDRAGRVTGAGRMADWAWGRLTVSGVH